MIGVPVKIKYLTTNDVMAKIGYKNPWVIFNLVVLGLTWSVLAMPLMIGAFSVSLCSDQKCLEEHPDSYGIAQEFELETVYASLVNSALSAGCLLCVFVTQIADTYGRKYVTFGSVVLTGVISLISSFMHNFVALLVVRFILGIVWATAVTIAFVLATEIIHFDAHPYLSAIFMTFWIIGYTSVAYVAYLFPNWHHMVLVASIPCIVHSVAVFFLAPESLFYLVEQGKKAEVEQWIGKAEKYGGKLYCDVDFLIENVRKLKQSQDRQFTGMRGTAHYLGKNKIYILYLVVSSFVWITTLLVFDSLSFNSASLGTNHYWSMALSGLVDLPANLAAAAIIRFVGRKWAIFSSFIMTGAVLIPLIFIKDIEHWSYLLFWLLGKSFISIVFIGLYVFGSEIFPTVIRSTCMGVLAAVANLGGMVAYQTPKLNDVFPGLDAMLLAGVSIVSAACMLVFPETCPEDAQVEVPRKEEQKEDQLKNEF